MIGVAFLNEIVFFILGLTVGFKARTLMYKIFGKKESK